MLSRRHFLAVSAAAAVGVGANACWIEPNRVSITRHVLGTPSAAQRPLRLVQLSDLHLQTIGSHEERVAEAVHDLSPDVLLLTGDAVDRADRLGMLTDFLRLLPTPSTSVAVLGNWEHWAGIEVHDLRRVYEAHGAELLINRTAVLQHEGRHFALTGLDDATGGSPNLGSALLDVEHVSNHLLLAHSPAYRERIGAEAPEPHLGGGGGAGGVALSRDRFAAMLSGHTHGGQVALLGWAPLRPPGSGRYVAGWYRDRSPHLYVSRGIGTSVIPARFGAPPEVACFEWHLQA